MPYRYDLLGFFFLVSALEEEFIHLGIVDNRRSLSHNVSSHIVLRECDVVADGLLAAEQRAEPVESESQSSVRRSSELEGVHQEAETVFCLLVSESQDLEHPLLNLAVVDTD